MVCCDVVADLENVGGLLDAAIRYLRNVDKTVNAGDNSCECTEIGKADYLSVDRSAMCSELSRMQREGLLRAERSDFTLFQPE